ncbi:MAG: universal stress protein [Ilumatobacter sp.]
MYRTIAVGTDGSKQALAAIRTASRLATLSGLSRLHVISAGRAYSPQEVSHIRASLPEEFRDLVGPHLDTQDRFDGAREILGPDLEMIAHPTSGEPADAILRVAEEIGADLIVVGARGLGAVERFVRGSVSTRVAQHSTCDVLIVEHDR